MRALLLFITLMAASLAWAAPANAADRQHDLVDDGLALLLPPSWTVESIFRDEVHALTRIASPDEGIEVTLYVLDLADEPLEERKRSAGAFYAKTLAVDRRFGFKRGATVAKPDLSLCEVRQDLFELDDQRLRWVGCLREDTTRYYAWRLHIPKALLDEEERITDAFRDLILARLVQLDARHQPLTQPPAGYKPLPPPATAPDAGTPDAPRAPTP